MTIHNIKRIIQTYNFRQAFANIRAYGLGTFLRNALAELTRPEKDERSEYFEFLSGQNNEKDPGYVPESRPHIGEPDIKLIAFYLPQFHPIPENDEWWGKGFTEWTNVARGVPQFIGHYQPRLPGELGFYDLRVPEVMTRQVELARQYGIAGFCFHFYWFNGRRLLEMPLERLYRDRGLDFPFCISWANENWTRRWDGLDEDILMAQNHCPEDDLAFIEYVSKYLRDERYIRIDSRPLLVVYRPALLPEPEKTAERWREWCRANGIGEIYLALTHSFEPLDPREIGFDAAIEFPPNTFFAPDTLPLEDVTDKVDLVNKDYRGRIFDYRRVPELAGEYKKPEYKKFRGICPGWDNEARRPGRGVTLANSSPAAYMEWLETICDFTAGNFDPEERLIFINAWNEWAEGAYLEPDRRYGYAFLDRTAEALSCFQKGASATESGWRILFVSHDAYRAGAQAAFLNIISWFKNYTSIDIKILCGEGGEWLRRFKEMGPTLVVSELRKRAGSEEELLDRVKDFCGGAPDLIYGNTVVAGSEYGLLHRLGAPIITHFHELEMSIRRYGADAVDDVFKYSTHYIACSEAVRKNLVEGHGVDPSIISMVHECIIPDSYEGNAEDAGKHDIRESLGLKKKRVLVFGCGVGMFYRKGADLFMEVARILRKRGFDDFHFYWVGDFDRNETSESYGEWSEHLASLAEDGLSEYVTFLGIKESPRDYFRAGDIFLLTSREDPFPLVALEAAECALPTVCFADAGGMPEFVEEDAGFVVGFEDVEAMADKVAAMMEDEALRRGLGRKAREKLFAGYTSEKTTPHILSQCRRVAGKKPLVSVIVPNYNHERYLHDRLESIFNQTFRDFEVILLDDASTDKSIEVLERYADRADVRVIRNETNTGSPFKQWLRGIDLAEGEILWIAESDDACNPRFLETLLPSFNDLGVNLAYCDSRIIDENGVARGDYASGEYLGAISTTRWKKDYRAPAEDEINAALGIKNTILNISGVLLRKFSPDEGLRKALEEMRIAGDWRFIVHAIMGGTVCYKAVKLNHHRRHGESVVAKTVSEKRTRDFFREFQAVQDFIFQNYELDGNFCRKWEDYLRSQWDDFYPGRPFEEIRDYYPFDEMKGAILRNCGGRGLARAVSKECTAKKRDSVGRPFPERDVR